MHIYTYTHTCIIVHTYIPTHMHKYVTYMYIGKVRPKKKRHASASANTSAATSPANTVSPEAAAAASKFTGREKESWFVVAHEAPGAMSNMILGGRGGIGKSVCCQESLNSSYLLFGARGSFDSRDVSMRPWRTRTAMQGGEGHAMTLAKQEEHEDEEYRNHPLRDILKEMSARRLVGGSSCSLVAADLKQLQADREAHANCDTHSGLNAAGLPLLEERGQGNMALSPPVDSVPGTWGGERAVLQEIITHRQLAREHAQQNELVRMGESRKLREARLCVDFRHKEEVDAYIDMTQQGRESQARDELAYERMEEGRMVRLGDRGVVGKTKSEKRGNAVAEVLQAPARSPLLREKILREILRERRAISQ